MIYKQTFIQKLLRIKKKCYASGCNHVFKENDHYELQDLVFGDVMLCPSCNDLFLARIEQGKQEEQRTIEANKKADYKILAEEIVKLMDIKQ